MNDLISKEAVIEVINKHKCDTSDIYLGVLDLPTIEAVQVETLKRIVERLEKQKKLYTEAWDAATWMPNKIAYVNHRDGLAEAIEIVKEEGGLWKD